MGCDGKFMIPCPILWGNAPVTIAFLSWLSSRLSESPRVLSDSILHSLPSSFLYITSSVSHGIYDSWYIRCSVRRCPSANTLTFYPVICVPLVCRNYPRGRLPATAITFRHIFLTRTNSLSLSIFLSLSSPPRHLDNPRLDHPGSPSHHRRPIPSL